MARVLVLRERRQGERTAEMLAVRGHEALILPTQRIVLLEAVRPPGPFAGFIATSANAVPFLERRFPADPRPVLAVGPRTAACLRAAGFADVRVGSGGAAEDLAAEAEGIATAAGGRPLLYAAGRVRTDGLERALARANVPLEILEVYDTLALEPEHDEVEAALGGRRPDAVLLLSAGQAASYRRLEARFPDLLGDASRLLCLSERIAAALAPARAGRIAFEPDAGLARLLDRLSAQA